MWSYVVALIGLAGLLAGSFASGRGAALDERLFIAINRRRLPRPLEMGLRLISHLGLMPTHLLVWLAVWRWIDASAGLTGTCGLAMVWVTCRLLKRATNRTRPYLSVPEARLVGMAPGLSSFPSSHAANVVYTAIAAGLLLGFDGTLTLTTWMLAAAVCYARIYLGAHYPRDVLGGAAIGLGAGLAVMTVHRRTQ